MTMPGWCCCSCLRVCVCLGGVLAHGGASRLSYSCQKPVAGIVRCSMLFTVAVPRWNSSVPHPSFQPSCRRVAVRFGWQQATRSCASTNNGHCAYVMTASVSHVSPLPYPCILAVLAARWQFPSHRPPLSPTALLPLPWGQPRTTGRRPVCGSAPLYPPWPSSGYVHTRSVTRSCCPRWS